MLLSVSHMLFRILRSNPSAPVRRARSIWTPSIIPHLCATILLSTPFRRRSITRWHLLTRLHEVYRAYLCFHEAYRACSRFREVCVRTYRSCPRSHKAYRACSRRRGGAELGSGDYLRASQARYGPRAGNPRNSRNL